MPWRMFFWNDELHVSPKGMVCDMVQSTSTILTIALKAIPLWQQALAECAKLNEADVLKLYVGEKKYILV